jgi:uncharacterized membrane protein YdbT with pleckstrin-like domain
MAYRASNLNPDERIIVDLHPHYVTVLLPSVACFVSLSLFIYALASDAPDVLTYGVQGLVVVSLAWALVRWVIRRTTHFVISSDRVIYRHGVFTRGGVEIPLEKVNNVNFRQTLAERLLKAGDLLIESGGEAGAQTFSDIPDPSFVQNQLSLAIEQNDRSRYSSSANNARSGGTYAELLQSLHSLEASGVITRDEAAEYARRLTSSTGN